SASAEVEIDREEEPAPAALPDADPAPVPAVEPPPAPKPSAPGVPPAQLDHARKVADAHPAASGQPNPAPTLRDSNGQHENHA
ncbi:DUF2637 domain-containing protein, partial [Streptomyces sp. DT18]